VAMAMALAWFRFGSRPQQPVVTPDEPDRPDGQLGFWHRD
jgi:hypothetical protein